MTVYVVTKTLYGNSYFLMNDFGYVDCMSEIMGIFVDERKAHELQDELYNTSSYEAYPWLDPETVDPFEVYIDVTVDEMEVIE